MARIRSIHPGQNQDEDFVEMSAEARLVCILLRCEADDQGVFEWKPKGLKMKLIPGDDWDINSLLSEMLDCQQVKRFEVGGRPYGAIRNFRKYQRPQKPNAVYPCPREVREYVGLPVQENETETGTVRELTHAPATPVRDQYDTATGIVPQMEDGGGRREEKEEDSGGGKPQKEFAFEGRVIRLVQKDLDTWRKAYRAIPDIISELHAIDAYYSERPPPDGKWFYPASNWLKKAHQRALKEAANQHQSRAPAI